MNFANTLQERGVKVTERAESRLAGAGRGRLRLVQWVQSFSFAG